MAAHSAAPCPVPRRGRTLPNPRHYCRSLAGTRSDYAATPDGGLARTTDGGAQWSTVEVGHTRLVGVAFTWVGADGIQAAGVGR